MSKNAAQEQADRVFEEALRASGSRDPREFYRDRLRELKTSNPDAYRDAVEYYNGTLIPEVASGKSDPLQSWLEYGCRLAEWVVPGRAVTVDPTGRRHACAWPVPTDHLLLHVPGAKGGRALVVGLPPELSSAQWATYELLVRGRLRLRPQSQPSPA